MQPCQGEAVNSSAFYGRQFREPRSGGNSDFAMTISDCKYVLLLVVLLKYLLLTVQMQRFVCLCVSSRLVCKHIQASSLCLSCDSVPLSGLN